VSIVDLLRAEGLTVKPDANWQTNVNRGTLRPEAVLLHWDAIRNPPASNDVYIHKNRFGGVLYHTVIQPDGVVRLISDGFVWNAGSGDGGVLEVIRSGSDQIPNPRDSDDSFPRISGNPYFYGVCIQYHPDYHGNVPAAQRDALIRVSKVYLARHGWDQRRVLHHRHWTRRKRDIDTLSIVEQRAQVAALLEQPEDETMFSKTLTAETLGVLYDRGIIAGAGRDATVAYWTDPARTDDEHRHLSNVIVAGLASRTVGDHSHVGSVTVR
jgi:hypothetical protein